MIASDELGDVRNFAGCSLMRAMIEISLSALSGNACTNELEERYGLRQRCLGPGFWW
jgi:hypothetical protein